ncbi:DUF3617 domain-containing protein [Tunturibacter empetritectus]|uniref:DUF3617 family protein n=1 Tax=Tunturiibacter empetritectus TaxID=3069691 RepID=A0A7W8IGU7_9BACT|nr:DUF3617 family protein [Edaphobacter lichenicola]MBB5316922.1 hypothetical protein [Edaphobacter lichenicola]
MNPGPTIRTLTLCAALLFLSVSALTAQVADLPIKPGLWNTQVVVKMGADDKDTQPISQQACFSAGSTISGYLTAITKSHPDIKCTVANKVQTGHHLVFDTICTSPTVSSKSHHDFDLADPGHFSGSSHTAMTGSMQGHPINMEMDKTFTGTFLSSDCGTVKPLDLAPALAPAKP